MTPAEAELFVIKVGAACGKSGWRNLTPDESKVYAAVWADAFPDVSVTSCTDWCSTRARTGCPTSARCEQCSPTATPR